MSQNPLLMLSLLQFAMLLLYSWVARNYYLRPRSEHPMVFWSPMGRFLLSTVPSLAVVGLVVAAFIMGTRPWWFLAGTIFMGMVLIPNPNGRGR